MQSTVSVPALKHKLDVLLARDVSAMGYEAKVQHRQRLEDARRDYQTAVDETRHPEPRSPAGR